MLEGISKAFSVAGEGVVLMDIVVVVGVGVVVVVRTTQGLAAASHAAGVRQASRGAGATEARREAV